MINLLAKYFYFGVSGLSLFQQRPLSILDHLATEESSGPKRTPALKKFKIFGFSKQEPYPYPL
jgi:hypothetical protein